MRSFLLALGVTAALTGVARADGDPANGEKIFKRCGVCHVANKDQNRVGPYLHGVIGRKSGSAAGYTYSEAMKNANITWADDTLDKYLTDPKAMVPGNKMAFPGLKTPQERTDVIAYLKQASAQ